jgi:hypothetical protein
MFRDLPKKGIFKSGQNEVKTMYLVIAHQKPEAAAYCSSVTEKGESKHQPHEPGAEAHTCNPSYSRGKDQEDHGLKSALANSPRDPISKILNTKKGLVEWLK